MKFEYRLLGDLGTCDHANNAKHSAKRFGRGGDRTRDIPRMVRSTLPLSQDSTGRILSRGGGEGGRMCVRATDGRTDGRTDGKVG